MGRPFCFGGKYRKGRDLTRHLQKKWRGWLTSHQSNLKRAHLPYHHDTVLKEGSRKHVSKWAFADSERSSSPEGSVKSWHFSDWEN